MGLGLPCPSRAVTTAEQKAVILKLCDRVVTEYGAYLAQQMKPAHVDALEREYLYCSEEIDELDSLRD